MYRRNRGSLRGVTVLRSWQEVGEAIYFLADRGYRFHRNPVKSWDLRLIAEVIEDLGRDQLVVDFGAADLGGVRLCYEMGFGRIVGYDLEFSIFDRLLQFRDWLEAIGRARQPSRFPYSLRRRSLLDNRLPTSSVAGVICLSVVEHGVDLNRFFSEVTRVLEPGGRLYLSTDYWEPKIDTQGRMMYGQPWTIFSAHEVTGMVQSAERVGLIPYPWDRADLRCGDAVVRDGPHSYTFVALRFFKHSLPTS